MFVKNRNFHADQEMFFLFFVILNSFLLFLCLKKFKKKENYNIQNRRKAGPIRQRSGSDSTEYESNKNISYLTQIYYLN